MASQLHSFRKTNSTSTFRDGIRGIAGQGMRKDSLIWVSAVALAILTAATMVFAVINFQKERQFPKPYDGVWWMENKSPNGITIQARRVAPGGPGENAGIKPGDRLLAINDQQVGSMYDVTHALARAGVWSNARYELEHHGVKVEATKVILVDADNSLNQGGRLIALIYLGIGLYVLFRRWTAPRSTHFYIFCLASFILYSFHYTGKFNLFDSSIFWSNIVAGLLQPALFLHFACTFPDKRQALQKRPWLAALVYVPGAVLLTIRIVDYIRFEANAWLWWNLDRLDMLYLALYFVTAAGVLWDSSRRANTPLERQQMQWITRGTVLAITPFTLFYVIPFLYGALPTTAMKVSVLSLVFLPLTFGYAIVRYRLMDVDIIFKRGVSYTLATAAIVGLYFLAVGAAAELIHTRVPSTGSAGLIGAIVITALLFDPVKNYIQEGLDRFFYRQRHDYRRTLVEFGRDLSSETDLDKLLSAVVDRL